MRCTKAPALATPAQYAHFAAKRAKYLMNGGASSDELVDISERWLKPEVHPGLYFA
jgi:hypothetical protein